MENSVSSTSDIIACLLGVRATLGRPSVGPGPGASHTSCMRGIHRRVIYARIIDTKSQNAVPKIRFLKFGQNVQCI